jgi:hypothetical protein
MRRIIASVASLLLFIAIASVIAAPASAVSSHAKSVTHVSTGTAGTSGNPSQPQPLSTADQNPGGANGKCPGGPYCSTRNGSPSLNGNGTGQAVGKPCAGCVGKADNKNPPGQYPNGTDANAGYECDRNHGIGRSNPAHTGCVGALTPTPTPTPGGVTPPRSVSKPPSSTPPSTAVSPSGSAGAPPQGAVSAAETKTPSGAAKTSPGTGPSSGETEFTTSHQTVRATPSALKQLPFTGIDIREMALLGLLLVAAGVMLRRVLAHR